MKLIKKIRRKEFEWILIALSLSGITSIIFRTAMEQTMIGFVIQICIVIAVFISVLISGLTVERKMVKRFQNELKGGKKA